MEEKIYIPVEESPYDQDSLLFSKTVESRGTYGEHLMYHIALDEETGKYYGMIGKVLEKFTWDEYSEDEVTNILRKHYYAMKNGEE